MSPDDLRDTFHDFLDGLLPRRSMRRRVSVREARRILTQQEAYRLVDLDAVIDEAIKRVEDSAVVFIDEIDKTITPNGDASFVEYDAAGMKVRAWTGGLPGQSAQQATGVAARNSSALAGNSEVTFTADGISTPRR